MTGHHPKTFESRIHLLLTALLVVGLAAAWLYIERANQREHDASLRSLVARELGDLRARLESRLYYNIRVVEGLESLVMLNPDLDQEIASGPTTAPPSRKTWT